MIHLWENGSSFFSTDDAAVSSLPPGATVVINILDANGKGRLDYTLEFTERVFALKKLTAKSTFEVDCGPINPGLLTYQYQEINADIFGLTIPTGLFGMLKGRVSYIETIYFDGEIWIDRSFNNEGIEVFNVYLKKE